MNIDQIEEAFFEQLFENQKLKEKIKQWEACADGLLFYAMKTLRTANNMDLYEAAQEDVSVYTKLKNETHMTNILKDQKIKDQKMKLKN